MAIYAKFFVRRAYNSKVTTDKCIFYITEIVLKWRYSITKMDNYYICLNCSFIQLSGFLTTCNKCRGATKELTDKEIEEYKKRRFKFKIDN